MTEELTPSEHAAAIAAALERLIAFVTTCSDEDWHARPLRGSGDARPVGVIADHVAHAYEYMGAWIREITADGEPEVTVAQIDRLNADHARQAELLSQDEVAEHLRRSGGMFAETIRHRTWNARTGECGGSPRSRPGIPTTTGPRSRRRSASAGTRQAAVSPRPGG
jgi:uncharacterized damage-inducible protein DinB